MSRSSILLLWYQSSFGKPSCCSSFAQRPIVEVKVLQKLSREDERLIYKFYMKLSFNSPLGFLFSFVSNKDAGHHLVVGCSNKSSYDDGKDNLYAGITEERTVEFTR